MTLQRWRAEVIRTTALRAGTQVLLLALADDMDSGGRVVVDRAALAERTGNRLNYVSKALSDAVTNGFLERAVKGGNGRRSAYVSTLPGPELSSRQVHSTPELSSREVHSTPEVEFPLRELNSAAPYKESRARAVVTAEPQPTVPQGDRLDGRRKLINDVRDELAKHTGKSYPIPWCSKVVDQIFVHGTKDSPSAYARTAIARDMAGPRRFIPTPQPAPWRADRRRSA